MNQADMNQSIRESLSAGVDGELSGEQLRFLLRRLEHDASLRQAWGNYHLAGDGLRQQVSAVASIGFADRVMDVLEQPGVSSRRNHWLRWSAGGAIAASVAAAALMISQPVTDGEHGRVAPLRAVTASVSVPQRPVDAESPPAAVPPWLSGNPAGMLSDNASATFGAPFGNARSAYPTLDGYRVLDNRDGSYLLLLDQQARRWPHGAAPQPASSVR